MTNLQGLRVDRWDSSSPSYPRGQFSYRQGWPTCRWPSSSSPRGCFRRSAFSLPPATVAAANRHPPVQGCRHCSQRCCCSCYHRCCSQLRCYCSTRPAKRHERPSARLEAWRTRPSLVPAPRQAGHPSLRSPPPSREILPGNRGDNARQTVAKSGREAKVNVG